MSSLYEGIVKQRICLLSSNLKEVTLISQHVKGQAIMKQITIQARTSSGKCYFYVSACANISGQCERQSREN